MTEIDLPQGAPGAIDYKARSEGAVTRQMLIDHMVVCKDASMRNDYAHRWMLGMITTMLFMLAAYGLKMISGGVP